MSSKYFEKSPLRIVLTRSIIHAVALQKQILLRVTTEGVTRRKFTCAGRRADYARLQNLPAWGSRFSRGSVGECRYMSPKKDDARATESNRMGKIVFTSAVVAGAALAVATACSSWTKHKGKKRKMTDVVTNTIDETVKAFKLGFHALSGGNTTAESMSEQDFAHGFADQEVVHQGYAYGAGADGPQWFHATWQAASNSSVRVEYVSTLDGTSSILALPSPRKTIIANKFVRKVRPASRFETGKDSGCTV